MLASTKDSSNFFHKQKRVKYDQEVSSDTESGLETGISATTKDVLAQNKSQVQKQVTVISIDSQSEDDCAIVYYTQEHSRILRQRKKSPVRRWQGGY